MSFILAISGSPRRGGNSERLLSAFCEGAEKAGRRTEHVRLNDFCLRPCQACDGCATTGECILQDDMRQLYPKVLRCRGLVVATPVYFGTLSAQLKTFVDRFQCWWYAKYRLQRPFIRPEEERPGFTICVGALNDPKQCESAVEVVEILFRSLNIRSRGSICHRGYDERGSIAANPTALAEAFEAGVRFAGSL